MSIISNQLKNKNLPKVNKQALLDSIKEKNRALAGNKIIKK